MERIDKCNRTDKYAALQTGAVATGIGYKYALGCTFALRDYATTA